VFSLLDGSAGVLDGQGGLKLAVADSAMGGEAGRKEKPAEGGGGGEPKSLLSATSEQLEKMIAGTGEALDKGAAGAKDALTRTWDELTGNEELHKGVEFGVKAAGEVSKDVWERVGEDVIGAGAGRIVKGRNPKDPELWNLLGPAASKTHMGYKLYKGAPDWANDLGARIGTIQDRVFKK